MVIEETRDDSLADRAQKFGHEVWFCAGGACLLREIQIVAEESEASNQPLITLRSHLAWQPLRQTAQENWPAKLFVRGFSFHNNTEQQFAQKEVTVFWWNRHFSSHTASTHPFTQ